VETGAEQGHQDEQVTPELADLRGHLPRRGVGTRDGHLAHAVPEPRGADGEIVVELVPREDLAERDTAVAHRDVPGDRQSEARSFTHSFGREERLEYLRLNFGIHATTIVRDGQQHVMPRLDGRSNFSDRGGQMNVARFDHQTPALRHRVTAVDGKIQQHLFELAGEPEPIVHLLRSGFSKVPLRFLATGA